ncbi:MAG: hypothetical protein RIB46_05105 [Pseudomonadales bacterium]
MAVDEFNGRMRAGGSPWGFYTDAVPDWIPRAAGARAWREYHIAVDDEGFVRGGYALKPQEWHINGTTRLVTDWQGPFTEGAVNARYATLGLRMIRDMLKKYPLLYSLGHGGHDTPVVKLLQSLGWTLHEMPICLKVHDASAFLRRNAYLRNTTARARLLDLLALTGLGPLAIRLLQAAVRWWHRPGGASCQASVVAEFGAWADSVWDNARSRYACLAARDSAMLNRLLPQEGWPGGTRLQVNRGGETIGWAVVHIKRMSNDPRFGDLNVGMISDCFATPEDAAGVIQAADDHLSRQGVEIVVSNQSHPDWVAGFRASGYLVLEGRRLFAISPELKDALEPFPETVRGLHLTNMDGHGPHGFTA